MPLAWNDVRPDTRREAAQTDRARKALIDEVQERAALLQRLGWPKAYALRRVGDDHDWETSERGGPLLSKKDLAAAVNRAYQGE